MAKSPFRFDWERARQVYLPLHYAYKNGTHAYSVLSAENSAPQNVFVPNGIGKGSTEHIQFLFFTMLVTLRSRSSVGFEKMLYLYEYNPGLFTHSVCEMVPADVVTAFRSAGVPHQHSWARYWIDCGRALFEWYRGDPLLLISEAQRKAGGGAVTKGFFLIKKELKAKNQPRFNGMGPKLFSLYCIFCEELGLVRNITDTMPADVWLQNLALATGVVVPRNRSARLDATELAEFLRINLTRFAAQEGISLTDMSHAQWLHGSEVCNRCHQLKNLEGACPIHELCAGSIHADSYWKKGKWLLDVPREPKGNSTFLPPENVDFLHEYTLQARSLARSDESAAEKSPDTNGTQLALFTSNDD